MAKNPNRKAVIERTALNARNRADNAFRTSQDYEIEHRANGVLSGSILRLFTRRAPRLPDMRSDSPQD